MYDLLFDVTVLGSGQVGKKTFAKCKFLDFNDHDYMFSIGMDFSLKTVEIDETIVKLRFIIYSCAQYWWEETPKSILPSMVRGAFGAIILYDVTNSKSLERIPQWIKVVKDNAGEVPILLVGNKLDLKQEREITIEQIEKIKNEHDIASSMEISVKTGENMEKMVSNLTRMILNSYKSIAKARIDVDEYKKRMITYINQAEEGVNLPDDYQNLAELIERLKNAINTSIHRNERKEKIVYGYVLLIRNCFDLLKEPILLLDKEILQTNIDQAYKSIHDILRRDRSIYYNTHLMMMMFLGTDQTRQFFSKYKVKEPRSLKPILPKKWYLYALYLIFAIVIFILLKAL